MQMKKILPFAVIILCLLGLQIGSERVLKGIFDTLEMQLTQTETVLLAEDFDAAVAAASGCIDYYTTQEKLLVYFIPNESLHLFQTSIYGMQTYAEEENRTEALAEAARARAQLSAIRGLYFRSI